MHVYTHTQKYQNHIKSLDLIALYRKKNGTGEHISNTMEVQSAKSTLKNYKTSDLISPTNCKENKGDGETRREHID